MTPQTLDRSLREHAFCQGFDEETVIFLSGCTKNVRFAAGDYLFREGTGADWMYLLRSGKVSLEVYLPGRGSLSVETVGNGEVLGWSVLFAPHEWHVDCRALENVVAFAVDGRCLRGKFEQDSTFAYAITRRLLYVVHKRLERARLQQLDVYRTELTDAEGGSGGSR